MALSSRHQRQRPPSSPELLSHDKNNCPRISSHSPTLSRVRDILPLPAARPTSPPSAPAVLPYPSPRARKARRTRLDRRPGSEDDVEHRNLHLGMLLDAQHGHLGGGIRLSHFHGRNRQWKRPLIDADESRRRLRRSCHGGGATSRCPARRLRDGGRRRWLPPRRACPWVGRGGRA